MLNTRTKQRVITKHQIHDTDTGSTDVTIAILTKRIVELTNHLKTHKKDKHSRRGLIGMVSRRRKLLAQLKKKQPERYQKLIAELGLKK